MFREYHNILTIQMINKSNGFHANWGLAFMLLIPQGERIIVPLLRCFGKLNFTYLGKLRLPDYIVYSGAVVDKGARVDEQK